MRAVFVRYADFVTNNGRVYAMATNGYGTLTGYNDDDDTAAFAMAGPELRFEDPGSSPACSRYFC